LTAHFGAHADKKKMYIYNILPEFVALAREVYSVSKAFSEAPLLHGMLTEKEKILEFTVNSVVCREH
jgi:hypothetical protein